MTIPSTRAATDAAALPQAIARSQQLNQQEFLNLLITELQNQDPMSPQDDKQFLAQMAQFSTVQGVTQMGASMEQLQAAALIGKTVDAQITANGISTPVSGTVQSIQFQPDGVHLQVGGSDVMLAQVQQVRQ